MKNLTFQEIDILIGVGLFYELLLMEQIKQNNMPVLQKSKLGWILGGEYPVEEKESVISCLSINNRIDDNLTHFWQLE